MSDNPHDGPDPGPGEPVDGDLLVAIREGSAEALEVALHRHWGSLYRYVFRILKRPDLAEEVAQQCFVTLWERRRSLDPAGSLAGFLYRTARNRALDLERQRELRAERTGEGDAREVMGRPPACPERQLEREALRRKVTRAVEELSPRRREVFVLAKFQGLSHREIAEALELAPQTVANHLAAALGQLREVLRPFLEEEGERGPTPSVGAAAGRGVSPDPSREG